MECSHFLEVHFRGSWGKDAYDRAIENIVFHRTPPLGILAMISTYSHRGLIRKPLH